MSKTPNTISIGDKEYYEISTEDDLYWFADQVNGGNNKINAFLMNDIVVNEEEINENSGIQGAKVWTPIGDERIKSAIPIIFSLLNPTKLIFSPSNPGSLPAKKLPLKYVHTNSIINNISMYIF